MKEQKKIKKNAMPISDAKRMVYERFKKEKEINVKKKEKRKKKYT